MIKSIAVINYLGEALHLNLKTPGPDGFEVRDIDGLTPVRGVINQSKVSTMPGVKYNSSTVDGRNVVITLGLLPAQTVEETRQRSYRYFPVTTPVTLVIETEHRIVTTTGHVESNEPPIFGKDPQTLISIVCEDAYFYDAGPNSQLHTKFYSTEGGFEFPFANDSLEYPLLEFGRITGVTIQSLNYVGDAESGITITIKAVGPVDGLVIYNPETNENIRIDDDILMAMTGHGIIAGDTIVITTNRGAKSATLIRGGEYYNILNALGRNVSWLVLRKGPNIIAYNAVTGESDVQIEVDSLILYEGV